MSQYPIQKWPTRKEQSFKFLVPSKILQLLDEVNGVNRDSKKNMPKLKAEADNEYQGAEV